MSMNTEEKEGSKLILVTGATGTLGRPLVYVLIDEGADIRAVTRNPQCLLMDSRNDWRSSCLPPTSLAPWRSCSPGSPCIGWALGDRTYHGTR